MPGALRHGFCSRPSRAKTLPLFQTLAVALHDAGHNTIGPAALAGKDLPTLGTGGHSDPALVGVRVLALVLSLVLSQTWRSGPKAGYACFAEGMVAWKGYWLLEKVQADGAGQILA